MVDRAAMDFGLFDKRNYPTLAVREGYAQWAPTYDETVEGKMDLDLLARQRAVRFEGSEVLDLACGTGRIGAWLAARGVQAVDGVDVTPEMLAHAARRGVYRRLVEGDVRDTLRVDRVGSSAARTSAGDPTCAPDGRAKREVAAALCYLQAPRARPHPETGRGASPRSRPRPARAIG